MTDGTAKEQICTCPPSGDVTTSYACLKHNIGRVVGSGYVLSPGATAPQSVLPVDAAERKATPMATGLLDYFPLALAEVARLSKIGNDQHNPGQPMHWARGKSIDHADTILRHLVDRGTVDTDGVRHSTKVAWRALAMLQQELEDAGGKPGRGSRFT